MPPTCFIASRGFSTIAQGICVDMVRARQREEPRQRGTEFSHQGFVVAGETFERQRGGYKSDVVKIYVFQLLENFRSDICATPGV